jgi:hypothetical protein
MRVYGKQAIEGARNSMSKRDSKLDRDLNDEITEELLEEVGFMEEFSDEFSEELSAHPTVEKGPTPAIAPTVGKTDKVLKKYTHCEVCSGRLHFSYVSDFSRNTTHEKSCCPECSLEPRQVLHRLQ